jgi:hypothetical protein
MLRSRYYRIWDGLSNLMIAYGSPSSGLHSPLHRQIAALFRGRSGRCVLFGGRSD